MTEMHKSKDEFYNAQSKEQLIIFLKNQDLTIKRLENTLYEVTGCKHFGEIDGTNGACVDCYYDNLDLFRKCEKFNFRKRDKNKKTV